MFKIAQILGIVGYFFIIKSYFQKNKSKYLISQILANVILAVHYLFLNSFSAIVNSGVSVARLTLMYSFDKNKKEKPILVFWIFIITIIGFGILTYKNVYSIIPITIAIMYTYAVWQNKLKVIFTIGVVACILWLIYNFKVKAYTALIGTVLELIVGIISLNRLKTKK